MSPGRDLERHDDDGTDTDRYGDSPQRSIFSALWFRVLLAVLVLGVLAAVAVPYVLDFATGPPQKTSAKAVTPPPVPPTAAPAPTASPADSSSTPAAPTPTPPTAAPATPPPAPETARPKPVAEKPAKATKAAEKAAPKAPAATKVAEAPKAPAKAAEPAKPSSGPRVAEASKPAAAKAAEAPKPSAATKTAASKTAAAAGGGPYWVQVGAFKEAETAKRVAARLREQGFRTEESTITRGGAAAAAQPVAESPSGGSSSDRYDVVVSGASAAEVDSKLAAKGLTGENTANGIVVRPSLPLREAVALSRDLADAGLTIQVRRVGGPAPAASAAPAPAPAAAGGVTLHRVRVGGFIDRATAMAAVKQLEEKGFKPFIARGKD